MTAEAFNFLADVRATSMSFVKTAAWKAKRRLFAREIASSSFVNGYTQITGPKTSWVLTRAFGRRIV